MQSPHAVAAFAEVGKAVLVSQNLEKLLIELLEFRKLHQDFDYATSTNGEMTPEMYKLNLTNGVKRLRTQNAIHPSLDTALVKYIEDRHVLVHRWALSFGIPDDKDTHAWQTLQSHANSVLRQAAKLYGFFTSYITEHAPIEVAAKDYAGYQYRMLSMFNREYPI